MQHVRSMARSMPLRLSLVPSPVLSTVRLCLFMAASMVLPRESLHGLPHAGCCALTSPMRSKGAGSWLIKSSSSCGVGLAWQGGMYIDSVVTCV